MPRANQDKVKVRQVGNALVVTLTEKIRQTCDVKRGETVTLAAFKGRITIRRDMPTKS